MSPETQKAVELLRRDVPAWNELRERDETPTVDLRGVDLSRANLRDADLADVDLSGARLLDACLDGADLRGATLRKTSFIRASMVEVDASEADFRGACLRGANLSDSLLEHCKLDGVNWMDTRLSGASLTGSRVSSSGLCHAIEAQVGADQVDDLDDHLDRSTTLNRSANILMLFLDRDADELDVEEKERCTRGAVVLGTLAMLAAAGLVTASLWDPYLHIRPGTLAFVMIVSIIALAILPQISKGIPLRHLGKAALGGAVLAGLVVAGFSIFSYFVPATFVAQAFGAIALGIPVVIALESGITPRWPVWRATAAVAVVTAALSTAVYAALGSPWIVPFLAERAEFAPLGSFSRDPSATMRALLPRLASVVAFGLIFAALRQAVLDWRFIERQLRRGLPRGLHWSAAVALVGIVPTAALYLFQRSAGPQTRAGE